MKKLVAYLTPVDDPAELPDATLTEQPPKYSDAGGLKVEVLLSDSDAERVLSTIAACKVSSSQQLFATQLIDKQLAMAGPNAHDLWNRIVAAVEKRLIYQVYADCDGVKTRAAARLGMDRNTLHKKLRQYHLIEEGADQLEAASDE